MLRPLAVFVLAAVLPSQTPAAPATADVPVGKAALHVQLGELDLEVFTYRPAMWAGERLLFVMHGVLRNADEYRDDAVSMGDRFDALIVAPKFDAERFPSRAYQRGGVQREDGSAAPPNEWTYARIPELAAAMRARTGRPDAQLYVIGHSAGGQFVMRMSAFQDTGAVRLVAANPGSDLFPSTELKFGYGFGGLPKELANDDRLRAYLAAPLTLYLGTADDHADDYFDKSAEAMQQGAGRHQRGLAAYWSARTLAAQRGWPFAWRLVEAPGIEHDHTKMFEHANCAVALFGPGHAVAR
ncbi:MAG TPA: hypothetical protein VFZ65_16590 [Planctomycetota bacterium]|nr:hypothetical protein [Planctomycetota bacterium]